MDTAFKGAEALPTKSMTNRNIGILAAEIYFPSSFVAQKDLGSSSRETRRELCIEEYDKVSSGKYTSGLGQDRMSFVYDNEDINSICMTVVSQLIEHHGIDQAAIGRIEVGTETIQDKSKSVKSYLMQLFPKNTDICGVDNLNACYGGTAAFLNTVSWIESQDWDGRLAIVVAGDIAVYEKGPARPTGGVGAVALLVGPNAPIIMERGTSAHFMQHVYDFYKPNPSIEYPIVDGKSSIECYLKALDSSYSLHLDKMQSRGIRDAGINSFDYFVFHAPFGKLVQRSLARLLFVDFLRNPDSLPALAAYRDVLLENTYFNRELDQLLAVMSSEMFVCKTLPATLIPTITGNCYCASLYSGLISLLCNAPAGEMIGKRIGMFSYGSGSAATAFSLIVASDPTGVVNKQKIIDTLMERQSVSPRDFTKVLDNRASRYGTKNWAPETSLDAIRPGTFYLELVDDRYRRHYNRKPFVQ